MKLETNIKVLEASLKESTEFLKLPEEIKDFREFKVLYLCTGNGKEENCTEFLPGSNGKCAFQDFSNLLTLCRKE